MNQTLFGIFGVGLAVAAFLAVLWLVPMMSRMRRGLKQAGIDLDGKEEGEEVSGLAPELIAVIAAAVAAASGMGTNEFRVVGVNRVEGSGSFNTPIWGHVDRLVQRPNVR
jgi:hypothetical protein